MDRLDQTPASGRRDFVKRLAYVAPAILTLAAAPAYAKAGSVKSRRIRNNFRRAKDR